MNLTAYLKKRKILVNSALKKCLPGAREFPGQIHQAMRYSVLGEGKRIRPILALAACEAAGGKARQALPAACALELIHAYSLVHDDLPAMDDDDFRRGKPSCHKRFGEAIGILAGDALLTHSFLLLSQGPLAPSARVQIIREVSQAIGTQGMIGGQVADVISENGARAAQIEKIHAMKTGALIAASVRVGALCAGASAKRFKALSGYGSRVGLVFQLVDDLLDSDGAVKLYGRQAVRRKAERLTAEAIRSLRPLGAGGGPLSEIARFILTRSS
ncbi:MAG: polyprenyl synthetase family protein [Candidatus Omnitrophica bacterium]|nr:polyprenyl synthetase family protein [Candidatus Omnitrophota bacterium]